MRKKMTQSFSKKARKALQKIRRRIKINHLQKEK
jgi:hypothetical protein